MTAAEAIQLLPEVADALSDGAPVVALESAVISHGLPRPLNLEVALAMEAAVREEGAVPATIAVVDGQVRIGLTRSELTRLAAEHDAHKLSTRDLAVAVARRATGGTTVAATAILARSAGIEVFATGGIGGVHRGEPLDVSSDLLELQRTPILVVCAGAKAILDLPATREALESGGVLLAGWQTAELPAFYSRSSGEAVDVRVESAGDAAAIWMARRALDTPGAMLLCVPVPEADELDAGEVEAAIEGALAEAAAAGIRGREVTPFLLQRVAEATGGSTLEANASLLRNNASVAGAVARAVAAG